MLSTWLFQNRVLEASLGLGTVILLSLFTLHVFAKPKRKITRIIDTMEVLKKDTVHIKNRDHVEDVVSQLIKGGASKLQVISDFDHTISRVHLNGNRCDTTYGIMDQGPFIDEDYKHQSNLLLKHYYPIEIDPNLTKAEKTPFMVEWYTKSLSIMAQSGIRKENIGDMVQSSNVRLRDGCDGVFHSLHKNDVPLLIFSAGVGDILKEVLRQQDLLCPNIKVIANFMQFDDENCLQGFKGDLIHTFNKNQSSLENSDYFQHLKTRNNVILLGDSLGDLDMSEGIENINCILRIGFLNEKIEENLTKYLNSYDIVLANDQTMDVVTGLLQCIL